MNPIRRIRRIAGILAAAAGALLALATASPAMAATALVPYYVPPAGVAAARSVPVVTRTVVVGSMPGWQIALIAAGAALLAAAIAVLADRARAAHRKAIPAT